MQELAGTFCQNFAQNLRMKGFDEMEEFNNRPRIYQPSIRYRLNQDIAPSLGLADILHKDYAASLSNDGDDYNMCCRKIAEPKSTRVMTTAQLTSLAARMQRCASLPLHFFGSKGISKEDDSACQKKVMFSNLVEDDTGMMASSMEDFVFRFDSGTSSYIPPFVQADLKFMSTSKQKRYHQNFDSSSFWNLSPCSRSMLGESLKGKGPSCVGISYDLGKIYEWMSGRVLGTLDCQVKMTEIKNRKIGDSCSMGETLKSAGVSVSRDARLSADVSCHVEKLTAGSPNCFPIVEECKNSSSVIGTKSEMDAKIQGIEPDGTTVKAADNRITQLPSQNGVSEKYGHEIDGGEILESKRKTTGKIFDEDDCKTEFCSSTCEKSRYSLAKQEHAIAGALAGVFVSLCLHPVDTIKTVLQSCRAEQRSICFIGKSIVANRGITGLYRGIAANITSSAPISAIYTFTYESVKGALLPIFPREHCSLAHCIAGGCASVATSFVFTPSERIKQQMQVNPHYHNCWNALVGIIGKGGLPSLYAGWGAVLCRNVPHSVIKFYTYESMKELVLPSSHSNAQLTTLRTLICGGLAGSTAALFTTPFDVVKTRLQTQIPGSYSQYKSVLHALQEISKSEGLKGLYRGLAPRLVMYMSQGALFFASYEFFKGVFSLEAILHTVPEHQSQEELEDTS